MAASGRGRDLGGVEHDPDGDVVPCPTPTLAAVIHGGRGAEATKGGLGRGRGRGSGEQGEEAVPIGGRGRGRGRGGVTLSVGHGPDASIPPWRASMPELHSGSGFAVGEADQGGRSRGLEVPLPMPNPMIGNSNDIENIWCHGQSLTGNGWTCGYCEVTRKGGGATRFKAHIAGLGVDCHSCMNAPHHVVAVFRKHIPEGQAKRRRIKEGKVKVVEEINHGSTHGSNIYDDEEDDRALKRGIEESLAYGHHGPATIRGGSANSSGAFSGVVAEHASGRVSATQWWVTFGDSTPLLQKHAIRIVSQCTSSSGCEHNWSLFALVHTQVRNRLGFEKLHKMVFCHHNLGIRIRDILDETRELEVDPCVVLMDVSLYDKDNPIMDWLAHPMDESTSSMDKSGDDSGYDSPSPTVLEVAQKNTRRVDGQEVDEVDGDEDEDEVDGEEEEDDVDKDNNVEFPLGHNQPLVRKSTRKRKKSVKLLSELKRKEAAKKV